MKKLKELALMLAVIAGLATSVSANSGTARLQIIHNAADPAAASVDIWVNGEPFLRNLAFRAATEFVEVPAGVKLEVGLAPAGSTSTTDILATFPLKLKRNQSYVAMASGVLDPMQFDHSNNGDKIAFNVFLTTARRTSWLPGRVSLMAFHGSTDAPKVDVRLRDRKLGLLFNNLTYGEFSNYRSLSAQNYILEITASNDKNKVLAAYAADLSGLDGNSAIVFASGFLMPANNQDGAAFGLFAALPNGTVVELPAEPLEEKLARLQIIHNAADPIANSVDIWVNNEPFLTNFAFRSATPFVDVPAGVELNVGVAPAGSSSPTDIIASFPITLAEERTYVAIANGVIQDGFDENPDGKSIAFNLFTSDHILEKSRWGHLVNLNVFHGVTDAPTIDVISRSQFWSRKLVRDLSYGEFSGYGYLLPIKYELEITPGDDNQTTVAKFDVDLSGLAGGAAIVFASGFLNSAENNGGAAFGLFAALADGTVIQLPMVAQPQYARLQVVHNAADPAAAMVDIYVNGAKWKDNFAFRTATAFETVPAGVEINIGVAGKDSYSANDTLANFTVVLESDENYIAFANGVLGSGFAPNPDGRSTGFGLFVTDQGRLNAENSGNVEFLVLHGATDAPAVDVLARGVATLVDDATYGDITGYLSVPPAAYTLDITPANDNSTVVATFLADLSGLAGGAAAVFASGFLSPDDNNSGPAFGLFAAQASGAVVELPVTAKASRALSAGLAGDDLLPREFALNQNYPNPFNPTTTIFFALPRDSKVKLSIYNLLGQEVETLVDGGLPAGDHQVKFDASALASGVYFYRLTTDSFTDTRKMALVK